MTEELRLWAVGESGEVEPLLRVQEMPTELAFIDLLVRNPEVLEPGLKLVGRQTPIQTIWLDLLAVDRDGRLVVCELRRGAIVREAVTQVLDYASDLDAMNIKDLTEQIAERSGNDGIQEIDDFKQWYADNFGRNDLSRLLPPRMVLIGLGVDPVAERMARFISGGPVDVSVVTFQGFKRGGDRLLARQIEVQPERRQPEYQHRSKNVNEKHAALREYLEGNGHMDLFDRVYSDLRQSLPKQGVSELLGRTGIAFRFIEADDPGHWKTYFGIYAGPRGSFLRISILPGAIRWGEEALETLRESIDLFTNPPGGFALTFGSEEKWYELRPAVLEFIKAVMANRSASGRQEP